MEDEEITQVIFDRFLDILREKNLSLYDRVTNQGFLFVPANGGFKVLKALKNISADEQKLINELLHLAARSV